MKNIEKAALLEYSDLALTNEEKEEIIYNCYDGKCTYNGKVLNVKGDMPDRGRIIVNEDGATFENIIIKGYNCIKENNKFTCNNTGLTKVNGTSILINNNKTTEIENYRIYGNSIQNGEPTPDNPVEIESVGDLLTLDNCLSYGEEACSNVGKYVIPIKVTGKNLFDISKINSFKRYDYLTDVEQNDSIDNGIITSNTSAYTKYVLLYDSKIFLDEGIYTIQANFMADKESGNKGVALGLYDYLNDKGYLTFPTLSNYMTWERQEFKIKISTPLNLAVIVQGTGEKDDYRNLNIKIKDIQLEYGDKATKYEPYKETITNIYLDSPLRSIGKYSDYIDFKSKTLMQKVAFYRFTGDEDWQLRDMGSTTNKFSLKNVLNVYEGTSSLSNYGNFIGGTSADVTGNIGVGLWKENENNSTIVYIEVPNSITSVDELKTYLKNNNIYICYTLVTPIVKNIKLSTINLYKDTSIISVNTTVKSSKLEIQYYK